MNPYACCVGTLFFAGAAAAQCTPAVANGDGTMGFWRPGPTAAAVTRVASWDPDGPGPASAVAVFAGTFDYAGPVAARNLAVWDPATGAWSTIGSGLTSPTDWVGGLLPLANGTLVVGGSFVTIGGVTANGIAAWNGTAWTPFGAGLGNRVRCLAQLPNGDLLAGGDNGMIAGATLARWTGTAWVPFGTSLNGAVFSLQVMANGDVVAGGAFTQAGGVAVETVARWNGTAWLAFPPVPTITTGDTTDALATMPNGDLVVARYFRVLRFDGVNWSTFGAVPNEVGYGTRALLPLPNGELWASGTNSTVSAPGENIYRWNGAAWQSAGGGCSSLVYSLARMPNGDVLAGGIFAFAGGTRVDAAARWDGAAWSPLSNGITGAVQAVAATADGGQVIGGDFTSVGGVACRRVARFVNGQWQPLGSGVDGTVRAIEVMANGDIVVAGEFLEAGGLVARRIARWNGSVWSPLGSGCNWLVHALAALPNGDLVATGEFTQAGGVAVDRLARWNGTAWSPLAGGGIDYRGLCLSVQPNGELLVGGEFSQAGGVAARNIARWNGSTFTALAAGVADPVTAVIVDDVGHVLAGRLAVNQSPVVRFDGAAWSPEIGVLNGYTPIPVTAFARVPGGDVVLALGLPVTTSSSASALWRRHNGQWTPLAAADGPAQGLALARSGELLVVGDFTQLGLRLSRRLARVVPPCAAGAATLASNCVAPGPSLVAASPSWLGDVAGFAVQGLSSNALAVAVAGQTPLNTTLAALHPAGSLGCLLLVNPDVLTILAASGGAANFALPLPATPGLVGISFRSQIVSLEWLGATLVNLTSSNAVVSTLGIW